MAFATQTFEQVIGWRIAYTMFHKPSVRMTPSGSAALPASELVVYLPHRASFDVRQVRDWLHDPDNNLGGYEMVGCFKDSMITGIKFLFASHVDAVLFRLSFAGLTTAGRLQ